MDDAPLRDRRTITTGNQRTALALVVLAAMICSLSGCSLFVMAGKFLFGDPKVSSEFKTRTKVDLLKDEKKVLVVCSTPQAIKTDWSSVNVDLLEGVTRRLKRRGIEVVDVDEVATWLDDNGGVWNDPTELARAFPCDYIIHIDLDDFSLQEKNSPTLRRGRATGNVFAYEVRGRGRHRQAVEVFIKEFTSNYPPFAPVSTEEISESSFQRGYLSHISTELSRLFYDYRRSETF